MKKCNQPNCNKVALDQCPVGKFQLWLWFCEEHLRKRGW